MRYLINLPLALALTSLAGVFDLVVLSRAPRGGDAAIGAAYAIGFGTLLGWFMLGVTLAACGVIGGLRWPQARGAVGLMVALFGFGAILVVSLLPLGIAMELNAARQFGVGQTAAARVVAFGLPFVLMVYAGWMINAPAASRGTPDVHRAALGAVGLLCLLAAVVSVRELGRQGEEAQVNAAALKQEAGEQADQQRRAFAALTDADPLLTWNAYLSDIVPADVRAEALRRIAARPQLEAELARALASDNGNWSAEALSLIVRLPFAPSAAMVPPVRDAISAYAESLVQESKEAGDDGGERIDRYEGYQLDTILRVAERLAETAGADLRDAVDGVVGAVALYPKSDTARSFPAKAADTKAHIAKILAARKG